MDSATATTIQTWCAVAQVAGAAASIGVAWWVAFDQKRRAEETDERRAVDFQHVMLTLAHEAIFAFEDVCIGLRSSEPMQLSALTQLWTKIARIERSAACVLQGVPPHASLAIGGAALCDALVSPDAGKFPPGNGILNVMEMRIAAISEAVTLLREALEP